MAIQDRLETNTSSNGGQCRIFTACSMLACSPISVAQSLTIPPSLMLSFSSQSSHANPAYSPTSDVSIWDVQNWGGYFQPGATSDSMCRRERERERKKWNDRANLCCQEIMRWSILKQVVCVCRNRESKRHYMRTCTARTSFTRVCVIINAKYPKGLTEFLIVAE